MQLTEALTSKAVRREITPGEELDRDYSIRTPEVKNYTLSISDANAIPPVDGCQIQKILYLEALGANKLWPLWLKS